MMDIFSSTSGSFYVMCDILPNFSYIQSKMNNNHPKLDGCGYPFLEGYFEV